MKRKDYFLLIGILIAHLALLLVLKFTAWPEMSLWPYLMTKGWLPYSDIAIAHTPLMLVILSLFYKVFGSGILSLKIFTWILILVFDGVLFAAVRKLWNTKTAIVALMANVLWMMFYDGNGLWFDLFMGILAFCSFYFVRRKRWILAGVFWALAFISKQTAVWFLIPIGLETINGKWLMAKRNIGQFVVGTVAISASFILLLFIFRLLPSFWNWAVIFGVFTLPGSQGQIQFPNLKTLGIATFPFLVFIPLLVSKVKNKVPYLVLTAWALAGVMGAYPRFEYFHFLPAVPFLAIATAGFFANEIWKKPPIKYFATLYFVVCLGLFGGFLMRNINEGTRFYEKDVQELSLYVKYNTKPGDRIFVLNWWDNIYALTGTLPSTDPWIPHLSWYMEVPGVQEKMIEGLISNPPKMIIFKPYTNMGLSAYTPQKVYNYVMENYKIVEKVDGVEILTKSASYANLSSYEDSNIK